MAPRKKIGSHREPKILKYPDSAMQCAIAAVREGRFKIREASRHFGVPHSTLINKLKGRVPLQRQMGPGTFLTKSEENLLVNYIKAMAKKGIPVNRRTLLDTVKKILDDDQRVTPFKNNRPGKKWFQLFYERHDDISEKKSEGISTARAKVSSEDLKNWHKSLKDYLTQEDVLEILEDPQRIFNADESGFQTCPSAGTVLGPTNMKNFYEVKSGKEKEQITVMVTINAAGQVVSPMVVYPLVRISKDIATNVPQDWAIGKSESGWMTGPLYYEFIANVFDPWIKEHNIKKPVLLLIDGHRSHLTLQVSQYCEENQIIAYALFPNSTHITQPADVSVFKSMKSGWKTIVSDYKQKSGNRQITRAGFAPLLAKVFEEKVTPEVIANGFKKCGIYPFDINGMDFTRCMDHETRKTAPLSAPISTNSGSLASAVGVDTLLIFESFMRRNRVQEFRGCTDDWQGDESAKELFYAWRKFRAYCLSTVDQPELPEDLTRCNTPVSALVCPEDAGVPIECHVEVSKTSFPKDSELRAEPNLLKMTKTPTSTRCNTPITPILQKTITPNQQIQRAAHSSMAPSFPEYPDLRADLNISQTARTPTSTRCNSPVTPDVPQKTKTPNLQKEAEASKAPSFLEYPDLKADPNILQTTRTPTSTRCNSPVTPDVLQKTKTLNQQKEAEASKAPSFLEFPDQIEDPYISQTARTPTSTRCNSPAAFLEFPDQIADHYISQTTRTPTSTRCNGLAAPDVPQKTKTPNLEKETDDLKAPKNSDLRADPNIPESTKSPTSNIRNTSETPNTSKVIIAQKTKQISPAFGNHIIWPSDSPIKNIKKERLPMSCLSKKWKEYFSLKETEKEEKLKQLEIRKRLREENKAKKTQAKKKKVTKKPETDASKKKQPKKKGKMVYSETDTDSEGLEDDSDIIEEEEREEHDEIVDEIQTNDYIVVNYEGEMWPGQVMSKDEDGAYVKCMARCGLAWKWPEKEDLIFYASHNIKFKINAPKKLSSKRALYHVPELEEKWGKPKK